MYKNEIPRYINKVFIFRLNETTLNLVFAFVLEIFPYTADLISRPATV